MARMGLIFIIGITAVVADLCPEPVRPNFLQHPFESSFFWLLSWLWMVCISGHSKWRHFWQKVWQLLQWSGDQQDNDRLWQKHQKVMYINSMLLHQVRCDRGFQLIGNSRLKCKNGIWSGPTPVCTVLGDCHCCHCDHHSRHRRHQWWLTINFTIISAKISNVSKSCLKCTN